MTASAAPAAATSQLRRPWPVDAGVRRAGRPAPRKSTEYTRPRRDRQACAARRRVAGPARTAGRAQTTAVIAGRGPDRRPHSLVATASTTDMPTRAAGRSGTRRRAAPVATGTSVPSATPARPSGCTSAMLSKRFASAELELVHAQQPVPARPLEHASSRSPCRRAAAHAGEQHRDRRRRAVEVRAHPGRDHAGRRGPRARRAAGTPRRATAMCPGSGCSAADRSGPAASLSTTTGKSTSFSWFVIRWIASTSRCGTVQHGDGRGAEQSPDDDRVDRVVQPSPPSRASACRR